MKIFTHLSLDPIHVVNVHGSALGGHSSLRCNREIPIHATRSVGETVGILTDDTVHQTGAIEVRTERFRLARTLDACDAQIGEHLLAMLENAVEGRPSLSRFLRIIRVAVTSVVPILSHRSLRSRRRTTAQRTRVQPLADDAVLERRRTALQNVHWLDARQQQIGGAKEQIAQIEARLHFVVLYAHGLANPAGQIDGNGFVLQLVQRFSFAVRLQNRPQIFDAHSRR